MLPCLRQGFSSFLFLSIASDRQMRLRVSWGMITSSMKPRWPAMKGLANFSLYSFSRAAIFAGSPFSSRKMISTAPFGPHHRDLGRRPGEVHVAPQVLRRHHVVGPAVGLAGDQRDLGDGALGVGVEQLGAVLDDAAVLLGRAGHEAGHVDERHDRDVEGVAEPDEPRRLDGAA